METPIDILGFIALLCSGIVVFGVGMYHYRKCRAVMAEGILYQATIVRTTPVCPKLENKFGRSGSGEFTLFRLVVDGKPLKANSCMLYPAFELLRETYDVYYSTRYPNYVAIPAKAFKIYHLLLPLGCALACVTIAIAIFGYGV